MISMKKATLLIEDISQEKLENIKGYFKAQQGVNLQIYDYSESILYDATDCIYYLYLDDLSIKNFLKKHKDLPIALSILPHENCPDAMIRYGLSKDIYEALEESKNEDLYIQDQLLLCNDAVVFKKVSLGNVDNLSQKVFETTFIKNIKYFFKNLSTLKYQGFTFRTASESKIATVASGVLILEDYTAYHTLKYGTSSSFHDGRLNAFIIAPSSLLSFLYHLILIFFYHRFSLGTLPKNIGFIGTKKLFISGNKPFDFSIDSYALSAKEIELEVYDSSFLISYGDSFKELIQEPRVEDAKEIINLKHLPKGEMRDLLIAGEVPLLQKASDEDMKETLTLIKEGSKTTSIFITLMILSTMLATVGIFQDSTPSVIGAMILAPLMAPIISLSMGAARSDKTIIKRSLFTLALGISSALFFSSILTLFMPLDMITSQMNSRIHPNLLDLFVAIFSGIAGAYATSKEEVAKSLAGVAIAVALVPPLAVTGIGIGWGEWNIIYGSFLLFMTNFVGMVLAASLTFIVLGFAPIHRAKKGLVYSSVFLSIVSIPLIFSFYSLVLQSKDYATLNAIQTIQLDTKEVQLGSINIKEASHKSVLIESELISTTLLSTKELQEVQKYLEKKLDKKVTLEIISKVRIE